MDFSKYQKAKRYILKCNEVWGKDFLHDAYIAWFNKTGKDIFEENVYTILTVLRFILSHHREKLTLTKGDLKFPRLFFNVVSDFATDDDSPMSSGSHLFDGKDYVLRSSEPNVDVILEGFELANNLTLNLSSEERDLLIRLEQGQSPKVISELTGAPYKTVHKLHESIKLKYQMLSNPFNGSKTQVKKKISEEQWSKRKDQDEFELEDESEYSKLFVHRESKEGWRVIIANPKGAEFYIKRLVDNE